MSNDARVFNLFRRKPSPEAASNPVLARAEVQLTEAANMIETVAYDLAGEVSTDRVARLMLMAADVERLADTLARAAPFSFGRFTP